MSEEKKATCFIVPLTTDEKREYERKRKSQGLTSQGAMRNLVLAYIGRSDVNERAVANS